MVSFNLANMIYDQSLRAPDALAVASETRQLAYGEFARRAAALAAGLRRRPDWPPNPASPPRVGILASRSVDACIALIGACWAGATYIPLGVRLPPERLLKLLPLCGLDAIIADAEGAALLDENLLAACPPMVMAPAAAAPRLRAGAPEKVEIVEIEGLPDAGGSEPAPMRPEDTAYIIFTSGTTGAPKGVMISAGAANHYASMISERIGLRADDRVLEVCELSFDYSVHNMFSTWRAGGSLHVLPASRVMNAVKFAREARLTVWNSVPSLVGMLRQVKALGPKALPDIRLTIFGGEQLPSGILRNWRDAAPNSAVFNLYGPTEVTVFCFSHDLSGQSSIYGDRDVVAIGAPTPGSDARIDDEQGRPVPDGAVGELVLAGVQLAQGYLDAPELTAARFPTRDGRRWYRTGDLAVRDASGLYHCLGRVDNQVKISGHRVELEEIDAHLRILAQVDLVGSVAWPLVDGAARGVVSFIAGGSTDGEALLAGLRKRLPSHMVPSRLVGLDHMPVNQSGKVDRQALRRILEQEIG